MGRLIAGLDHRHPTLAIADQIVLECQAGGIPRADDAGNPLVLQIVIEQIPGEFMGEFEALDQALLLQLAERPLARQLHAALQHLEGPLKIVEPLAPADIWIGHRLRLGRSGSELQAPHRNGIERGSHALHPTEFLYRLLDNAVQVVSFSEARESFKAVLDRVEADADVTLITRRHAKGAVVMSLDTYNSLMETVHLLRSPANAAHLQRSLEQADRGELLSNGLIDPDLGDAAD